MENQNNENNPNEELEDQSESAESTEAVEPIKRSKFNPKVLIFGLPVFIIQLIAVYFITANILLKKMEARDTEETVKTEQTDSIDTEENKPVADTNLGEHIFQIEDIIVNPASTVGDKLLLSSVAFDVPEESYYQELEKKQILIKDLVISVLSSKTISQLGNISYKDTLRSEITEEVQSMIENIKINKVYFSKYIIN